MYLSSLYTNNLRDTYWDCSFVRNLGLFLGIFRCYVKRIYLDFEAYWLRGNYNW
jgi:hypothetical protein